MLETIVKTFLERHNAENLYEDLMDLLTCHQQLRWEIFRDVERENHREDVRDFIQDMLEDCAYDEPQPTITDETIEQIVDRYEDTLGDDGNWRIHVQNAIDWVVYDEF